MADEAVTLVQSLLKPEAYPHPVSAVALRETHISWVFLTGDFAYKVKKPIDFGFLNFTSLDRRKFYCEEEIRLNRRLAPSIYLSVVPILQTSGGIRMGLQGALEAEAGEIIDYAVQMRQFSPDLTLDRVEEAEGLSPEQIDRIAQMVADFHAAIARAPASSEFGTPEQLIGPPRDNFRDTHVQGFETQLETLRAWTEQEWNRLRPVFAERKAGGFVRECHGDMHLGNIALVDGEPLIFDCIEFNDPFRWIDVISDAGFLVMDLVERGHPDHAYRFLNRYLELTGDYAGLAVLRFYLVYRAMVRAKVASLRLSQTTGAHLREEFAHYVQLALTFRAPAPTALILTCGLSGSGKTRASREMIARGMMRVRSDVERKRLFSLAPEAKSGSALDSGIYTASAASQTYDRLLSLSETILGSGYCAVADATFLEEERRKPFVDLAAKAGVPVFIVHCTASPDTLRARVQRRLAKGLDASEAGLEVLEAQLQRGYRFSESEQKIVYTLNTEDEEARAQTLAELFSAVKAETRTLSG